jgi:hypothetical protein
MGLRAWARRREQRARPSQRVRHAASWTGSQVARLSVRAVQPLAARPDLTAELAAGLMLEASYVLGRVRARRQAAAAQVKRRA